MSNNKESVVTTSNNLERVEQIRTWLTMKVAELLSIDPEVIDSQKLLSNYGLSSMTGMILSGDIEEWLDMKLDPAIAWEYPTIDALVNYLSSESATQSISR